VAKCNLSFVFKGLKRGAIRTFHVEPYFSIQVNDKLDFGVQGVTRIIFQGAKPTFENFRVQSVIRV